MKIQLKKGEPCKFGALNYWESFIYSGCMFAKIELKKAIIIHSENNDYLPGEIISLPEMITIEKCEWNPEIEFEIV